MNTTYDTADSECLKDIMKALFLINGAHKNLEKEREKLTASITQMSYLSNDFTKHSIAISEKVTTLDQSLQAALAEALKNCAKDISAEASRSFISHSSSQTETVLRKLIESTTHCENKLHQASEKIAFFSKWFMSVAVGGAIIGGLLVGGMMRYLPAPALDKATQRKIESGEILEAVWPKLDQKERERIKDLAKIELEKNKGRS